jgi:hypothetical protein
MEVSNPTWKFVAPKRARKTGKKGVAAETKPTPSPSSRTYEMFLEFVAGESSVVNQRRRVTSMRERF